MRALAAFAWSVVQDALHRKVFYAILAFTFVLILLIPLLPSADIGVQIDLLREAALGLTSIMAFVLGVILAATIIPREREKRTVYNTLSRPVQRWQYYLGKYIGIMLIVTFSLLLTYLVLLVFIGIRFSVFNPGLAKALFTILLEAMVLVSVAMLASVFYGPVVCVMLAAFFYVVCHVKGDFLYHSMNDAANNPVARFLAGAAYYVLPNLERLNINETVAHSERVFEVGAPELFLLFAMAVAFSVFFTGLGIYLFSRRDL